jgi:hypothetical protein
VNTSPNSRKRLSRIIAALSFLLPLLLIGQAPAFADVAGYGFDSLTVDSGGDVHVTLHKPSGVSWPSNPQIQFHSSELPAGSVHTFGSVNFYCGTTISPCTMDIWTLPVGTTVSGACLETTTGSGPLASWGVAIPPCAGNIHYCDSTSFQSAAGSFVNPSGTSGSLSIRFTWTVTLPSGFTGWDVKFPADGTGFDQSFTKVGGSVDGQPNVEYYQWDGVTAHTPLTALITAPDIGSNLGCSITVTLSGNQISQIAPDTSTGAVGDTQTSDNPNCGFSLNPFHYLKCLFEPTDTAQEWNTFSTTAESHPPISTITSGYSYVTSTFGAFNNGFQGTTNCSTQGITCPLEDGTGTTFQDPTGINSGEHQVDFLETASQLVQTHTWSIAMYDIIKGFIALGGFLACWNMVAASFGGKGSAK